MEKLKQVILNEEPKAWDVISVISKLLEATDILLHEKDYDGHGWEEIEGCFQRGKVILKELKKL